jgi:NAD(P)-dependent dehydrogenase (short-subunit alcohol dehydrogenase family)
MTAATTARTVLVTGASAGIGQATALRLRALGFTVYAAARRAERLEALVDRGVRPLPLDVTDHAALEAAVKEITDATGGVDVLVNNAGYGEYGAIEDVPLARARHQFETNVFGAARLVQLVLPGMRARGVGRIITVTSVGGRAHTPLDAWYHATKFALEAIHDCLRMEVAPFGIDVVLVEPGGVATEWGAIAARNVRATSGTGPYAGQAEAIATVFDPDTMNARSSPPELIAAVIAKAVTADHPRTRYVAGYGARAVLMLRRILSDRRYDRAVLKVMGVR